MELRVQEIASDLAMRHRSAGALGFTVDVHNRQSAAAPDKVAFRRSPARRLVLRPPIVHRREFGQSRPHEQLDDVYQVRSR